jgi:hypothetical protein
MSRRESAFRNEKLRNEDGVGGNERDECPSCKEAAAYEAKYAQKKIVNWSKTFESGRCDWLCRATQIAP